MQQNFDYNELSTKALRYLENELGFKYWTLRNYRLKWLFVKRYMDSQNLDSVNPSVCESFLLSIYKERVHRDLSTTEKILKKAVSVLIEFMKTGAVCTKKEKITYLDGSIGSLMSDFLITKKSRRLSEHTIVEIERSLGKFNLWLSVNSIFEISDIGQRHLIGFIKSINSNLHNILINLRGFFKYLYEEEIITVNIAALIPKDNYNHRVQIPSYYTEDEIQQLLKAIDRGTSLGKRDYAILIIAAYLGLRASDIARLTFQNLYWENSTVVIKQYKTGKELSLPLLPIVGNAILDYIQYGRPTSNEHHVFLLASSPFRPVKANTIATFVGRRFISANIRVSNRKHGAHALRHSLVKELLKNGQSLPVITEVLGHKSIQSSRHYIRIDTDSLRQCALDVPAVDPHFYAQKEEVWFL